MTPALSVTVRSLIPWMLVAAACSSPTGVAGDAGQGDVEAVDAGSDVALDASKSADVSAEDTAVSSPSGESMPVGDVPGWHQVFADDFTTDVPLGSFPSAVSAKWTAYQDGWKDTSKNGTYEPSQVLSVSGGVLDMYLHTANGIHMVSAPEPIIPGGSPGLPYGRYVVRFHSDPVAGYKTAWLLWPDSGVWPQDGEIDFPEGNLTSTISAFMHQMNATSGSQQDAYPTSVTYTSWHTADLVWTAAACSFTLDGTTIGTSTALIPSTPMHWVLQTETQLSGGPPSDTASGHVQVDWVVVYVPN
jgi:hypothetical protein